MSLKNSRTSALPMTRAAVLVSLILALAPRSGTAAEAEGQDGPVLVTGDGASLYRLGPGDTLKIQVYGEDDLSGAFPINDAGAIEMPLLGLVRVSGLTATEAGALVRTRLADGFLRDPSVTAWLDDYQSQQVQVLGAVRSPGQYFLRGPTTLLELLSNAGIGDAGVDEVRVTRGGEGGETTRISYARLLADGSGNLALQGGDIVFVPESLIIIMGQVKNPGEVSFREGMTLSTAVAAAGGALPTASLGRVYLVRGEDRQRVNLRKVMRGRHADVQLQPGDRVIIQESVF